MSFINNVMGALRFSDDEYDDEYEDYELEEEYEEDESRFKLFGSKASGDMEESRQARVSSKVTPIRANKKNKNAASMEVCVIKPNTFAESKEIAETLLADRTVILNIEGLDIGLAQRILDFSTGCCYAINGNLERINNTIIILSPSEVNISGDLSDFVDTLDFSGF